MSSKSDIAAEYASRVVGWISLRDKRRDYDRYEHRGKINRRTLSAELGFGRSVPDQNPAVKAALICAESRWFTPFEKKTETGKPAEVRMVPETKLKQAEQRNSKLVKENASLRAANAALRSEKLRSNAVEELIAKGGRYKPVSCEMISKSSQA